MAFVSIRARAMDEMCFVFDDLADQVLPALHVVLIAFILHGTPGLNRLLPHTACQSLVQD